MAGKKPRRKLFFRKMTWLVLIWVGIVIVWIVSAAASTGDSIDDCLADGFLTRAECEDAVETGAGIGVFIILVFGAVIFLALMAVWFATRPRDDATRELAREMRLAREAREAQESAARHSIDT